MKKIFLSVVILFASFFLISCDKKLEGEINILVPNGIPYIALGEIVGEENVTVDNKSADNLSSGLIKGDYDIIVAPLNMGVKLYNAGNSKYKLAAVLTLGNTYVVSRSQESFNSLTQLNGKKVMAFGEASVPGIMFKLALSKLNVTPDEVNYQASVDIAMSLFASNNDYDYLLVSEPYLTKLEENQTTQMNYIDLNKVIVDEGIASNIYQASIFVNPDSNIDDINIILDKIEKSTKKLNESTTDFIDAIIDKDAFYKNQGKESLTKSLPRSSVTYINAKEEKTNIEGFLTKLQEINAQLIGGKLPSDDFYL